MIPPTTGQLIGAATSGGGAGVVPAVLVPAVLVPAVLELAVLVLVLVLFPEW